VRVTVAASDRGRPSTVVRKSTVVKNGQRQH